MTLGKAIAFKTHAFVIALAVIAYAATPGRAWAQYWGDRQSGWGWNNPSPGGWGDRFPGWSGGYPSERRYRQSPYRDFFPPFSGERHNRSAPAVDYSKAPPPRKLEKPPSRTIVVIGDSMADWLGYGLDENYSDQPEIAVHRKIRATSGLVRYDAKNEALDWPQAAKDALANEKQDAIVVMLGLNDRVALRGKAPAPPKRNGETGQATNQPASQALQAAPTNGEAEPQADAQIESQQRVSGGSYNFHTDQWAALYTKRIDAMIAALKSKGVPLIWVGLPAIRGTKATSDINYLDELYRERAERAGIVYVNIWDGFVDGDGDFAMQGPDFEGQIRRLRTADGVYFTKGGAVKLASYVDRELRRVMPTSPVAPVPLPAPETPPNSGSASARPDVSRVFPLSTRGGERGGDLLGGKVHPTQTTSDPIAAKVLDRGETLAAPAGRADDFSWPRPGSDVSAGAEISAEPVAAAPSTPEKQSASTEGDSKKKAAAKKETKGKSEIDSRASARVVPHRYYNYSPGRR